MSQLVVLGATGATGHRVVSLAVEAGLRPVVAGRREDALREVAAPYGLSVRVGSLSELERLIEGARVVVSSVGPYARFGPRVVEAVLRAGASYVDFTGEPRWVETLLSRFHSDAVARGSVLVPSVGLGVAADIAGQLAASKVADVEHFTIGYRIIGMRPSAASFESTLGMFAGGAPVVSGGRIEFVPVGSRSVSLPGGNGGLFPTPDPLLFAHTWPGVSAECYMQGPLGRATGPLMSGTASVLRRPRGMSAAQAVSRLWAHVPDSWHGSGGRSRAVVVASGGGESSSVSVSVDDVYDLTARAGVLAARRLLAGAGEPGVRSWGSVVGDPRAAAAAVGARIVA